MASSDPKSPCYDYAAEDLVAAQNTGFQVCVSGGPVGLCSGGSGTFGAVGAISPSPLDLIEQAANRLGQELGLEGLALEAYIVGTLLDNDRSAETSSSNLPTGLRVGEDTSVQVNATNVGRSIRSERSSRSENSSIRTNIARGGIAATGVLAGDDLTVIGVADNIFIPAILLSIDKIIDNPLERFDERAKAEAAEVLSSDKNVLFHFTNEAGFLSISTSQLIRGNNDGIVFATSVPFNSSEAFTNLFIQNPRFRGRGDFVIGFKLRPGLQVTPVGAALPFEFKVGPAPLRFGRQIDVIFAGPNPF